MISLGLAFVLLLYLTICTVWAVFLRRMRKSRVRFFCVLASFIVALVATFITKSFLEGEDFTVNTLIPLIASGDSTIAEFMAESDALRQTMVGMVSSLLAPSLFLVYFLVANFFSWIVYLLITLIAGARMKEKDAERTWQSTLATIGFSVAKVFLVIFVWMVPVIAYMGVASPMLEGLSHSEALSASDREMLSVAVEDYIKPIEEDPAINTFKFMGAGLVADSLTTFKVEDSRVDLGKEVGALSNFVGAAIEFDVENAEQINPQMFDRLSSSFAASETLPAILSEIVHDATGAWKGGEAYLGVYRESVSFDSEGMFDPFIDKTLEILYEDTTPGRFDAMKADIDTVFDILEILIARGVFNSEVHDDLLYNLARDGTVTELIEALEKNESMKVLVPEITAIGVNAIGSALGGGEEFAQVMETVATELNGIKAMGDVETQKNHVSGVLREELSAEGLMVSDEVIEKYADLMVDDLINSKEGDLTSDDITVFFAENAWRLEEELPDAEIPDEIPDGVIDDYLGNN